MRSRIFGILILAAVFAGGIIPTRGDAASDRQQALAWFAQPTLLGSTIVQGPVLVVHDEAAMRRGEPCTRIFLFEPGKGPLEEVTSFHCLPVSRKAVRKFTATTRPNAALGYGCVLTEYQFAGDTVGHGVPVWETAN